MKPKNKLQHLVVEKKKLLPIVSWFDKEASVDMAHRIADKYNDWVKEELHKKWFTTTYKSFIHCLECGHKWKGNAMHSRVVGEEVCPSCNSKLKYDNWHSNGYSTRNKIFSIVTTVEDFQVIRIFIAYKDMHKGIKSKVSLNEIIQHWITKDGKLVTLLQKKGNYGNGWVRGDDLEVRGGGYGYTYDHAPNVFAENIHKDIKITKWAKKLGFKASFHNMNPHLVIRELAKNNMFESLWKLKRFQFAKYCLKNGYSQQHEYRNQIRLAYKHKYKITDVTTWYDYIDMLSQFNRDLNSPKYLFPKDLRAEHDRLNNKLSEIRRKRSIKEREEKIKLENLKYNEKKKKFKKLKFKKDNLVITSFKSASEVLEHSKKLRHCAFNNEYHLKNDSLLMAARIDGIDTETVEVSLTSFTILQSRGNRNNPSKYHNMIKKLVRQNINQIKKAM